MGVPMVGAIAVLIGSMSDGARNDVKLNGADGATGSPQGIVGVMAGVMAGPGAAAVDPVA